MPSFNFNLTRNPASISNARPKDEIINNGLNTNPTIKPVAPKNCNIMIIRPNFSKPNRLNSISIFDDLK